MKILMNRFGPLYLAAMLCMIASARALAAERPVPALPPAANSSLIANWFCNVTQPIKVNPLITVMHEQGTETNCPSAPIFSHSRLRATARSWPLSEGGTATRL